MERKLSEIDDLTLIRQALDSAKIPYHINLLEGMTRIGRLAGNRLDSHATKLTIAGSPKLVFNSYRQFVEIETYNSVAQTFSYTYPTHTRSLKSLEFDPVIIRYECYTFTFKINSSHVVWDWATDLVSIIMPEYCLHIGFMERDAAYLKLKSQCNQLIQEFYGLSNHNFEKRAYRSLLACREVNLDLN